MKKGLLTVLLASLVLVGCQNYDDQFDDLNAQISALKSQVDGLSSLSGQVSSLSGSISGLQAGVNAAQAAATAAGASADAATAAASGIDLSGLSSSLATLQAEVDAVQASLATAATASAVAALQTELDAIEADVDELLATSNVYNTSLVISNASTLDAAVALGNNLNIVNGSVTITQSTSMDATKLQSVIDKIFTVTGNYSYTASAATVTAMTFDKLASTGDLTLAVNGPISASSLVTAGTVNLKTTFSSSVTSINMDLLSSVTEIQSQGTADAINFSNATDVQLGSLAVYTDKLTITTKKGATLDIGSLDDLNSAGTVVDMSLTVSGPKDVTISGWDDSYTGTITATNVENLTVSGYEGAIVIGDGVENATVTGGVDVSLSSADDLVSVDLTTKLYDDPNVLATVTAKAAYAGAGKVNDLVFSSANLTTINLNGYWGAVTSTDNANVTSIDIDATMKKLTIDNNDNLTSLDVTGSEINDVTFQNNSGIETVVFDHTTELNYVGDTTDDEDVVVEIIDNEGMTSLTWGASNVQSLTVTGNDKLNTVDFTGLAAASTDTTATIALNVRDNDLTVATASDIVDGLSDQYAIDGSVAATGANNDALDLGTYATDGGMSTLKPYLVLALADADATGNVHFDTVTTHTIATDAIVSGETAGTQNSGNASTFEGTVANGGAASTATNNWVGLVWYNNPSDYESTNPTQRDAQKEKRAFILDVSTLTAGTTTISMLIDSTDVFETNGTFGDVTIANTSNLTSIINQLKTTAAVSRAADLGATLDVYVGANSVMPSVTLQTGSTSASNYEGYTDAQIASLEITNGLTAMEARVTTYDQFTYTVGGRSVVATITLASGVTSAVGTDATAAVATAVAAAWNAKYGTGASASETLSFWSNNITSAASTTGVIGSLRLKDENSGSRAYGQTVAFDHSYKASAAQISLTVVGSGTPTYTFIDWLIGTDDKQLASSDNKASDVDIIISLEETLASGTVINGATAATITLNSAETLLTELETSKTAVGVLSTTLSSDIFEDDAGIYGSIYGGGAGDVRSGEDVSEGLIIESGSRRAYYSRIHWLG
jgi:hypothetical protein